MTKLPKILLVLLALVFLGNLLFLDYFIFGKKEKLTVSSLSGVPATKPVAEKDSGSDYSLTAEPPTSFSASQDACSLACQLKITEEVSRAVATISGTEREIIKETVVEKTAPPTRAPQTVYLPLGNGSSTQAIAWTDVAGSDFIFDLADYGTETDVYWQGNLKIQHANSRCYARIDDVTNKRAVDFSEQTWDQTAYETLTSPKLSIWRGKNNYRLQIKSLNGINCSLESPRLIIISQ